MTSIELLKEIESWLCFNTEPSEEETAKLRKSIKDHLAEQLRKTDVRRSFWDEFNSPLNKVERKWLRRFALIGITPIAILLGMIAGVIDLIEQLYNDCW